MVQYLYERCSKESKCENIRCSFLINADDRVWKINQLLFADDMASEVDSEKKLSVGGRIWMSVKEEKLESE